MAFKGEEVLMKKWYGFGGAGSGSSIEDLAAPVAGDVEKIPAGMVVTSAEVIVETALAGTTAVLVGDDDDADGFVAAADVTEGTIGVYNGAGAYLASGAKKYYGAEGKEVKLAVTGTLTAGKYCVVVRGYRV